jgi:membrane-associated protease RseP (regulator of RpoE activity)
MEDLPMIDTIHETDGGNHGKSAPPSEPNQPGQSDEPVLRPEARVMRADRSLAAMVLVICTLGGMGVGFGFAMYLMRAQLAYAPLCAGVTATERADLVSGQTYLGVRYWSSKRFAPIIYTVVPNTAADQAGVRAGDIIMSLGGRDLRGIDLHEAVIGHTPGEIVPIGIVRSGQRMVLYARLGFL